MWLLSYKDLLAPYTLQPVLSHLNPLLHHFFLAFFIPLFLQLFLPFLRFPLCTSPLSDTNIYFLPSSSTMKSTSIWVLLGARATRWHQAEPIHLHYPTRPITALWRIRSCINSLCVKMQVMQPSTGVLTRSIWKEILLIMIITTEEIPLQETWLCACVTVGHGKDDRGLRLRLDTLVCYAGFSKLH